MIYRSCFQHLYDIERKRIVTPPNVRMRLNRGERPEPLPVELREELLSSLAMASKIQQYPSYPVFYEKLATYVGYPKENIVVGAGIEEFIRTLMFLCCDPGDKVAVLWPTCAMYEIYAKAFGLELVKLTTFPGLKEISLCVIPDKTKLVFIPNPGQPVDTHFELDTLSHLAEYCSQRDIVLAIDEAHYGFGAKSALPLIDRFENVVVLRTFSKYFSAASIRVGFAVGRSKVIKPLDAVRPSGEISGPSMQLATVLLDNPEILDSIAQETIIARDWLRSRINNTVFIPVVAAYGQWGFSVLIKFSLPGWADGVASDLAARGIYVKSGFPAPVDNCLLVACGSLNLMREFYAELMDVVTCRKSF